jgi:hypothetical protein
MHLQQNILLMKKSHQNARFQLKVTFNMQIKFNAKPLDHTLRKAFNIS